MHTDNQAITKPTQINLIIASDYLAIVTQQGLVATLREATDCTVVEFHQRNLNSIDADASRGDYEVWETLIEGDMTYHRLGNVPFNGMNAIRDALTFMELDPDNVVIASAPLFPHFDPEHYAE